MYDAALAATQRALDEGGVQSFDMSIDTPVGRRELEARVTASGQDEATAIIRDFTEEGLKAKETLLDEITRKVMKTYPGSRHTLAVKGQYRLGGPSYAHQVKPDMSTDLEPATCRTVG